MKPRRASSGNSHRGTSTRAPSGICERVGRSGRHSSRVEKGRGGSGGAAEAGSKRPRPQRRKTRQDARPSPPAVSKIALHRGEETRGLERHRARASDPQRGESLRRTAGRAVTSPGHAPPRLASSSSELGSRALPRPTQGFRKTQGTAWASASASSVLQYSAPGERAAISRSLPTRRGSVPRREDRGRRGGFGGWSGGGVVTRSSQGGAAGQGAGENGQGLFRRLVTSCHHSLARTFDNGGHLVDCRATSVRTAGHGLRFPRLFPLARFADRAGDG